MAIKVLTIILCRNNIIFNGDDDNFSGLFMEIYLLIECIYDFEQWQQAALLMSRVALEIGPLLFLTKPKSFHATDRHFPLEKSKSSLFSAISEV